MVAKMDVLVIGGGMSGAMAAIASAREGLSVTLVRRSAGATALASGAVDFRGVNAWLQRLLQRQAVDGAVQDALSAFLQLMAQSGYAHQGGRDDQMLLVGPLGTLKHTQVAAQSMAAGDLQKLPGASILFVGIRGYRDFDASYVAKSVEFFAGASPVEALLTTGAVEVEFPRVRHSRNLNGFDLAQLLDDEATASELGRRIAAQAQTGRFTCAALPAIVGRDRPEQAMSAIQRELGMHCFETLALPPSVPGLRLQRALDRCIKSYGIQVVHAAVDGFCNQGGQLVSIRATQKDTVYEFEPRVVVLATGKFVGGGIQCSGRLLEPVFDLPVFVSGRHDPGVTMGSLVTDSFTAEQPIFAAGVKVDERLRPVAGDGRVIYPNLMAAGTVVTGYDHTRGIGGLGLCLATGHLCGRYAADHIRQ